MSDRDLEQTDYGYGYQGQNSPQQHVSLKVEGGTLAIALALLAIGGVLIAAILLPEVISARAKEASTQAIIRADIAEREARVAIDQVSMLRLEMAKRGVIADNH